MTEYRVDLEGAEDLKLPSLLEDEQVIFATRLPTHVHKEGTLIFSGETKRFYRAHNKNWIQIDVRVQN